MKREESLLEDEVINDAKATVQQRLNAFIGSDDGDDECEDNAIKLTTNNGS